MKITAEAVELPHPVLDGADWADCWTCLMPAPDLIAIDAASRLLEDAPVWVRGLMDLRNRIVALLGLKTVAYAVAGQGQVGGFPVLFQSPGRVVLGFDDRHLDFRIVVDVAEDGAAENRVSVTTLVKRHNLFGRLYIAAVTPFHRLIVRNALGGLGKFTVPASA